MNTRLIYGCILLAGLAWHVANKPKDSVADNHHPAIENCLASSSSQSDCNTSGHTATADNKSPDANASPEWGLYWVGLLTLIILVAQANEMRKATEAMRDSIKEVKRQADETEKQTPILRDNVTAAMDNAASAKENAKAAERSVEMFISKERARITVKPKYDDGYTNAAYLPELAIEITQHGPTKAFNVVGRFRYSIEEGGYIPAMRDMWVMTIENVIPETATPIVESALLLNLEHPNLLAELELGKKFLHFFGEITYTDVFEKRHRTAFRYVWKVEFVDIESEYLDMPPTRNYEQGWEERGPKEDNEAT